jgi:hypothetical protein
MLTLLRFPVLAILRYAFYDDVGAVEFADSTMKMDHQVVREISALVSGLPVMSDQDFQLEFLTVCPTFGLRCR